MRAMQQAKRSVSEAAWLTMPRDRKTRLVHEQLMQSSRDANARSARVAENHANDSTSLRKRREPHGSDPQSTACAAPPQRTVRFATTLASDLEANADRPPLKKQATQSMHDTKGRSGGASSTATSTGWSASEARAPALELPRDRIQSRRPQNPKHSRAHAAQQPRCALRSPRRTPALFFPTVPRRAHCAPQALVGAQAVPVTRGNGTLGRRAAAVTAARSPRRERRQRGSRVQQAWKAAVAEAAASETAVVHTMSEARPSVTDTEKDGSAVDGDDDDDVEGDQARLADEDADAGPGDKLGGDEMKLLKRRHRAAGTRPRRCGVVCAQGALGTCAARTRSSW